MLFGLPSIIVMGLARHLLTAIGGLLISKGWLTADILEQVVGAVLSLAGVVMSASDKVSSGRVIVPPTPGGNTTGGTVVNVEAPTLPPPASKQPGWVPPTN